MLPNWLPGYGELFGEFPADVTQALLNISPPTIDRLLSPIRFHYAKRGESTTKPGTLLRKQIPIKTHQWDESRPGFLEADTVAHCGDSTAGMYVNTIDFVDIATGWTEQRAVWGRAETEILEQIKRIEKTLPFQSAASIPIREESSSTTASSDTLPTENNPSGSRSRAYHNDDNAHIEQKNWTHIRQWLGYDRLDKKELVPLLNNIYAKEWRLFHNFFCPSVKLIAKRRVGSKTIKLHDPPQTPY